MNKNILAFIKSNYTSFEYSDLIFKILSIFFYNYILIIFIELTSPYGFNSISFFSESSLPYTCALTANSIILSIIFILLYKNKHMWSVITIRAITQLYISVSLLICSIINFDGYKLSLEEPFMLIIKLLFFISCLALYPQLLNKKILPKYQENNQNNNLKYIVLAPCIVICFRSFLTMFDSINVAVLLKLIAYMLSMALLINSLDLLTKAFYAKKYHL